MDPQVIGTMIPIVALLVGGAIAIFAPLARAHARQLDKQAGAVAPDVAARLERMEQSLEAVAIEIERITEGQRFTTKLLSERVPPASAASLPTSAATPPGERRS